MNVHALSEGQRRCIVSSFSDSSWSLAQCSRLYEAWVGRDMGLHYAPQFSGALQ
jgi:hypothetical protein